MERTSLRLRQCLESFRRLQKAVDGCNNSDPTTTTPPKVHNHLPRSEVWAGNLGVHCTGQSFLDYQPTDAPSVRKQLLTLLDQLIEFIRDASSVLSGETTPREAEKEEEQAVAIASVNRGTKRTESTPSSMTEKVKLVLLLNDIEEIMNCLIYLSAPIDRPESLEESSSASTLHVPRLTNSDNNPFNDDGSASWQAQTSNVAYRFYLPYEPPLIMDDRSDETDSQF
ncbi:hypothetical protein B0T21DRAFT_454928 [Apiosordaria backusii]|uniref:Uncharacterized protein n=1 Tax=Apiosordaria backusii TaxID=314023 RepID=A0AA40DR71_9PEZI|nr:hypothetical protein B0T21DRAFT_454928 [Apiosordaria backusii]